LCGGGAVKPAWETKVLLISQGSANTEQIIHALGKLGEYEGEWFNSKSELFVSIRPHPTCGGDWQNARAYEQCLKEQGLRGQIVDCEADVNEQIVQNNLILTSHSTVGFNAILLGKPLIVCKFANSNLRSVFDSYPGIVARTEQEFVKAMRDPLNAQLARLNELEGNYE